MKLPPSPGEGGFIFKIFSQKNPPLWMIKGKLFWKFFEWIIILINQLKITIFIKELNSENLIVQHGTDCVFSNWGKILI